MEEYQILRAMVEIDQEDAKDYLMANGDFKSVPWMNAPYAKNIRILLNFVTIKRPNKHTRNQYKLSKHMLK